MYILYYIIYITYYIWSLRSLPTFLYPILTAASFRRILYTDHEGQSQMCLAYFTLTGYGWWKEHAIGDAALWLGLSRRTEIFKVASNYRQWLHWQFFRRQSKTGFHDKYKTHSSDVRSSSANSKPSARHRILKLLLTEGVRPSEFFNMHYFPKWLN